VTWRIIRLDGIFSFGKPRRPQLHWQKNYVTGE